MKIDNCWMGTVLCKQSVASQSADPQSNHFNNISYPVSCKEKRDL